MSSQLRKDLKRGPTITETINRKPLESMSSLSDGTCEIDGPGEPNNNKNLTDMNEPLKESET